MTDPLDELRRRRALGEDDWRELDAAFSANFDPYKGAAGEYA